MSKIDKLLVYEKMSKHLMPECHTGLGWGMEMVTESTQALYSHFLNNKLSYSLKEVTMVFLLM